MNLFFVLCIAYAGIIFGASSVPGSSLPDLYVPDYVLHGLEYMGFGIFVALWLASIKRPYASVLWQSTFLGSVYGLTDEFHQYFVPGRCADPRDWVADTLGVLAGTAIILLVRWIMSSGGPKSLGVIQPDRHKYGQ